MTTQRPVRHLLAAFAVGAAAALTLAACGNSAPLAPVTQPGTVPDDTALEPSVRAFLSQNEIRLPARSQVIESVDIVDGCGRAPAGARTLDGRDADWIGVPTGIAGSFRHDAGEFIWTEYPYDDGGDGAFQYPGEGTPIEAGAGTAGRAGELMQRYGANAADVVEVRAAADDGFLYLMLRFNFVNAVDATVVGLGFDLDGDAATGRDDWPRGAHIASTGRGLDLFITAHGACAYVEDAQGERTLDASGGAIRIGTRDNVMELAVPLHLLAGARRFDVVGGAGLWDAAAQTWMPVATGGSGANTATTPRGKNTSGAPEVFNLLFRDDEASVNACGGIVNTDTLCQGLSARTFQTRKQIEALRAGHSGPYAAHIDLARLQPGAAGDPMPVRRGDETFFTRVYRSRIDAEGTLGPIGNAMIFTGRYQPYTLYVPACYETGCAQWPDAARAPLALQLHGGGNDHLSAAPRPSIPEGGNALYGSEDFFAHFDREIGALIASPLGRGLQAPSWRGYGEADALEVLDDVRRAYGADRERQGLFGGSQGGYGTLRIAGFHPDVWNGVFVQCPVAHEASANNPQGHLLPSTVPFVIDPLIDVLLNQLFLMGSGTLDPLAPITMNHRLRDRAFAAGLDARYTEYLGGSHCFDVAEAAYPFTNAEAPAAARAMREPRRIPPARVRYRIDPRQYRPGLSYTALADTRDLVPAHAGAWWATGLRLRPHIEALGLSDDAPGGLDESSFGKLDVISHALPDAQVMLEDCSGDLPIGVTGIAGGTPESESLTPTPNLYQCQRQQATGAAQPRLDLDAAHLEGATLDLAQTGLADRPFVLRASGDGDFELRFSAGAPAAASGDCLLGQTAGALRLRLSATTCEVRIEP